MYCSNAALLVTLDATHEISDLNHDLLFFNGKQEGHAPDDYNILEYIERKVHKYKHKGTKKGTEKGTKKKYKIKVLNYNLYYQHGWELGN
jgi:hypothetical protein